MKTKRYEVKIAGKWYGCKAAKMQPSGWLHYELRDGTVGLSRPGNFRDRSSTPPDGTPGPKSMTDLFRI